MSLKSFIKKAGKSIGKAKNILLPIAGVAAGLALPGVGGLIGKVLDKGKGVLDKVKAAKAKNPGILGIGDKKPGIFGIGTGKGLAKVLGKNGEDGEDGEDGENGTPGTNGKNGVSPLVMLLGGGLALYAATR
jgi:hypothetical protein